MSSRISDRHPALPDGAPLDRTRLPASLLARLLLALVLGEPLTREEGRQLGLEVLRLRRELAERARTST